jgi:hypothetical protein
MKCGKCGKDKDILLTVEKVPYCMDCAVKRVEELEKIRECAGECGCEDCRRNT